MTSETSKPQSSQPKPSQPKTSNDLPAEPVRKDTARDTRQAAVKDADNTGVDDRDLVHGEGGTIDLPTKPGDLNHDD